MKISYQDVFVIAVAVKFPAVAITICVVLFAVDLMIDLSREGLTKSASLLLGKTFTAKTASGGYKLTRGIKWWIPTSCAEVVEE